METVGKNLSSEDLCLGRREGRTVRSYVRDILFSLRKNNRLYFFVLCAQCPVNRGILKSSNVKFISDMRFETFRTRPGSDRMV